MASNKGACESTHVFVTGIPRIPPSRRIVDAIRPAVLQMRYPRTRCANLNHIDLVWLLLVVEFLCRVQVDKSEHIVVGVHSRLVDANHNEVTCMGKEGGWIRRISLHSGY